MQKRCTPILPNRWATRPLRAQDLKENTIGPAVGPIRFGEPDVSGSLDDHRKRKAPAACLNRPMMSRK